MPLQHSNKVKTLQELAMSITPMIPGQLERIPWTWFDTQTYTSGTTVSLDFFQTVNNDKNLSNMTAAGQIPAPQFFDLYQCSIAYLTPASIAAAGAIATSVGAVNDVRSLSNGSAVFSVADKQYWQGPQFALPCGGGPSAAIALAGTYTAGQGQALQHANNGVADLRNRYSFWGDITLPHNQNFLWRLTWSAPITLALGNTAVRVWMDGYLYRRVL